MSENEEKRPANTVDPAENIPESGSKYDYSTIFDCNGSTEPSKDEYSSREYLKGIYKNGEELDSSLNKDVRYTRSQYLKEYETIENNYNGDLSLQRKSIAVSVAGGAVLLFLSIMFFKWADTSAMWATYSFIWLAGYIVILIALAVPVFLIIGFARKISKLKKAKERSIEMLEKKKKDHMLMGTYDSGK
ncbi:MAG: phage holin family protein [Candidatus Fimenecus sp.]